MTVRSLLSLVVPTYNERGNLLPLHQRLRTVLEPLLGYELIVVDDNSPDGTGEEAEALARRDPRVRVLRRPRKLGLGSAVLEGFRTARGDLWGMMDADLSHRPEDLPRLLAALAGADIAVGSRYIEGAKVVDWPRRRWAMSRAGCLLVRALLRLPVADPLSGFALFRREALEPLLPSLRPLGFKFLLEVLARSPQARVVEVPIVFEARGRGRSKVGGGEVLRFLALCLRLASARRSAPGGVG